MFKKYTKIQLCELLQTIGKEESKLELARQSLCSNLEFEPYAAFKRIDRARNGVVNCQDFVDYLKSNGIIVKKQQCEKFVQQFDVDKDLCLSYTEFLRVLLPIDNPNLRFNVTQRPNYEVEVDEYLPYDVEYALAKLIEMNINIFQQLEYTKILISNQPDFNIKAAFKTIAKENCEYLDCDDIWNFFSLCGMQLQNHEINSIFKRMDKDDDGIISYQEFEEQVLPTENILRQYIIMNQANQDNIQQNVPQALTETFPNKLNDQSSLSCLQSQNSRFSPKKSGHLQRGNQFNCTSSVQAVEQKERNQIFKDCLKLDQKSQFQPKKRFLQIEEDNCNDQNCSSQLQMFSKSSSQAVLISSKVAQLYKSIETLNSPQKSKELHLYKSKQQQKSNQVSSLQYKNKLKQDNPSQERMQIKNTMNKYLNSTDMQAQQYILNLFKDFIKIEKELEIIKQDLLICQPSFSLIDIFNYFVQKKSKGVISSIEFEEQLNKIGIYPEKNELFLFIRNYDKDCDGKLNQSEFLQAFQPNQKDFASLLISKQQPNKRIGSGCDGIPFENIFQREVREQIKKLIEFQFSQFSIIEKGCLKLFSIPNFNLETQFKLFDTDDDGFLQMKDIKQCMQIHSVPITDSELQILQYRLDADKDQLITYVDIVEVLTPKTSG